MPDFLYPPEPEKIPFHRRFGLRFLQVLLIVCAFLLIRRCIVIYQDNRLTSDDLKIEYFDKGFANGLKKAQGLSADQEPGFSNYALKKAYRDGYRQGWDKGREKQP